MSMLNTSKNGKKATTNETRIISRNVVQIDDIILIP